MAVIEFEPDLTTCIQTLAGREYDRTVKALLASGEEDPELGERVRTLQQFLESTDFGELRSRYEPHLVGGMRVRFTLLAVEDATEFEMHVFAADEAE